MKKRISAIFLMLMILYLLLVPAMATQVDMDYTGIIDSYTGQPVGPNGSAPDSTQVVPIGDLSSYERESKMFVYQLSSVNGEVRCNVADGMVVTQSVKIYVTEGLDRTLYYEGGEVANVDWEDIHWPGSYLVQVGNTTSSPVTLRFTIVNYITGKLQEYRMPKGFEVMEVQRDGIAQSFTPESAPLKEEGEYKISYRCVATGVPYELAIQVDHTPPTLALEAVVNNVARSQVDLSDLEEGATLYVTLNGKEIKVDKVLTTTGSYVVTVEDQAGNATTYKFVIQFYLNSSGVGFFVTIIALTAALIVYLILSRKRLRVR